MPVVQQYQYGDRWIAETIFSGMDGWNVYDLEGDAEKGYALNVSPMKTRSHAEAFADGYEQGALDNR